MMFLTPCPSPHPRPQYYVLQYYVPQYHHSGLPYVGHPPQYSVQPTGPSTFYPGLFPADCPLAYEHKPTSGTPCTTPTAPQVSHSVPQPEPLIGCRPLLRVSTP
ncbi:hypothetical protein P4O66_006074, partial [Electrophorus voltai]